jgi:hypothetical protein
VSADVRRRVLEVCQQTGWIVFYDHAGILKCKPRKNEEEAVPEGIFKAGFWTAPTYPHNRTVTVVFKPMRFLQDDVGVASIDQVLIKDAIPWTVAKDIECSLDRALEFMRNNPSVDDATMQQQSDPVQEEQEYAMPER